MKNIVIIPALEPEKDLISYVEKLLLEGIPSVLVIDDGSSQNSKYIFEKLSIINGCKVLTHTENMGKGAALKTGISYVDSKMPHIDGIITADADSQHSVLDVLRVNEALSQNPNQLALGVREFDKNTPTRSILGNRISSKTLKLIYGIELEDTQTGLRAVSRQHFTWLLSLAGERYEYEVNMLINSKKEGITLNTITIQTLYFDNNAKSHFRSVRDGSKVYSQMLKVLFNYAGNSFISAIADIGLFYILFALTGSIFAATAAVAISSIAARVSSSLVNFKLNQNIFSKKEETSPLTYIKYYTLWISQLTLSILFVLAANSVFGISQTLLKPIVDLFLAMISYQVQLHWVFTSKKKLNAINIEGKEKLAI